MAGVVPCLLFAFIGVVIAEGGGGEVYSMNVLYTVRRLSSIKGLLLRAACRLRAGLNCLCLPP